MITYIFNAHCSIYSSSERKFSTLVLFVWAFFTFSTIGVSQEYIRVDSSQNPFSFIDIKYSTPANARDNWASFAFTELDRHVGKELVVWKGGSKLFYYQNMSTPTKIEFIENPIEVNLSAAIKSSSSPGDFNYYAGITFVDLDNDGHEDLVVGGGGGDLMYFKRVIRRNGPLFVQVKDTESPFYGLGVGVSSRPVFTDHDGDGDLDMFIGIASSSSILRHFKQTKNANGKPVFKRVTDLININKSIFAPSPALIDLDNDGDQDLVVSVENGAFNYLFKQELDAYHELETYWNFVQRDNPYMENIPVFEDLDYDNIPEMILGTNGGSTTGGKIEYYVKNTMSMDQNGSVQFAQDITVTGDIYTYKKSEKDHRIGYSKSDYNSSGINTEKVDGNFQFITYPNNFGGKFQHGGFIIGENTGNSTMEMYGNSETFFRGNVHLGLQAIPSDLNVTGKTTSKDFETSGITKLKGNTTITNLITSNIAQLNGGATTTSLTVDGTTNLNGTTNMEDISSSSLGVTGHTSSNSLSVTNDISSKNLSVTGYLQLDGDGEIFTATGTNKDWRIGFNEYDSISNVDLYNDLDFYQYITYSNDYMDNGTYDSGFVLGQNGKNSSLEIYGDHESFFRGDMQIGINKEKERSNLKISGNLGIGTTNENPKGVSLNVIGGVNLNAGLTVQKSATVMDTLHVGKMIHAVGGVNTSNITATGNLAIGADTPVEGAALTILGNTYLGSQKSLLQHKGKAFPKEQYKLWVDGDIGINGDTGSKDGGSFYQMDSWPDYVFDVAYDLLGIADLKKSISEKGHLPYIPSAADVKKNGYGLHDMNKRLLKTVEELTLYTIQQEEKIQALQMQLDDIKQLIINSNK